MEKGRGEGGMENTGTKEGKKKPVRREDVQTKLIMKCAQVISAAHGFPWQLSFERFYVFLPLFSRRSSEVGLFLGAGTQ